MFILFGNDAKQCNSTAHHLITLKCPSFFKETFAYIWSLTPHPSLPEAATFPGPYGHRCSQSPALSIGPAPSTGLRPAVLIPIPALTVSQISPALEVSVFCPWPDRRLYNVSQLLQTSSTVPSFLLTLPPRVSAERNCTSCKMAAPLVLLRRGSRAPPSLSFCPKDKIESSSRRHGLG